jgi:hypothetical protein
LLPLTVDVAPSDASRVYLSARLDGQGQYASVLLRSTDGGLTFTRAEIPETAQHHLAYIAGVSPTNPSCIYLRVFFAEGTRLYMSDDGGVTFKNVFAGTDQLYGFTFSPDGANVAFGGPGDGIWVGPPDGTAFTRRSDLLPTCLGWGDEGLFACADQKTAPFSIGRSRDFGSTFETILRFDSLCGATSCGPETDCGKSCPHDWEVVGPALGATCGLDAGVPDAATTSDLEPEAGPPSDAGPPADASEPGFDAPHEAASSNPSLFDASGGGCTLRSLPQRGKPFTLFLTLLAIARRAVRRHKKSVVTDS